MPSEALKLLPNRQLPTPSWACLAGLKVPNAACLQAIILSGLTIEADWSSVVQFFNGADVACQLVQEPTSACLTFALQVAQGDMLSVDLIPLA